MGLQRHLWGDCRLDKRREKLPEAWGTDKLKDCVQPKGRSNVHQRRQWPAGVTKGREALGLVVSWALSLGSGPG